MPAIFLSEERYRQALRHAERAWLLEYTDQLQSGELQWPRAHLIEALLTWING